METVNISELRANLLNYLKKAQEGQEIMITSHGQALATIIPPVDKSKLAKSKLKKLAKRAVINDVINPIDDQWEVFQ